MKTCWINASNKDSVVLTYLEENTNSSLLEVKWTPFRSWIKQNLPIEKSTHVLTYNFYKRLNKETQHFPLYGKMFTYYSFARQLISFAQDLALYQCPLSALPITNDSEKELKCLLQYALEEDLFEKHLGALEECNFDLTDVITTQPFLTDYFDYTLHQKLLKRGVTVHNLYTQLPRNSSYRHALNPTSEIESIAQEIVHDQISAKDILIICADTAYYAIIQQVFERYQIPHGFVNKKCLSRVTNAFCAYLTCFIKKDVDSLIHAFEQNCFTTSLNNRCLNYIHQFIFTLDDFLIEQHTVAKRVNDTYLNRYEYQLLLDEENEFNQFSSANQTLIHQILTLKDVKEILTLVFNHCVTHFTDPSQYKEIASIKNIVEELSPCLLTIDDLDYLVDCLHETSIDEDSSVLGKLGITDFTHPLPPRKRAYVVGASQRNFPAFPTYNGIFDEAYRAKTTLPSMQERFDAYMIQLQWIEHSASEDLYYTYSTLDYQGKKSEAAFEIESKFTTIGKCNLLSNNQRLIEKHSLQPELAKELFFKDARLYGSISSFEKYFQCPYAYFIKSGLRIDKPSRTESTANTIGTIQHAILEYACQTYGKEYATITKDEMTQIAQEHLDFLSTLLPKEANKMKCIMSKMIDNLSTSFQFLKEMELNTSFTPAHFEYQFVSDYFENITLRGTIDRIDFTSNLLRVIDYKSSSHSLDETSIKSGLKLQLLTYLIIATKEFNREAVGSYYYSLKNDNIDLAAAKVSRGQLIEFSDDDNYQNFIADHRLSGWTFVSSEALDYDARHCINLSITSKGMTFKLYDFELVDQALKELYALLVERLNQGLINVDPVEGACTYCNYSTICRFKGVQRKAKPLVLIDSPLKKGKESDEMES